MKKKTDAEKRAQRKYDTEHKYQFKSIHLKYNVLNDADILAKLDAVENKQDYVRQLILKDIEKDGK